VADNPEACSPRIPAKASLKSPLDFPFRQVTVAYHQALSILIPAILMELNVLDNLVFYRCLQKLARSFLQ
jgi:hypothetical protein